MGCHPSGRACSDTRAFHALEPGRNEVDPWSENLVRLLNMQYNTKPPELGTEP